MVEEEFKIVELQKNFYHDGIGKIIMIAGCIFTAIVMVIAVSAYLYFNKPPPVTFPVSTEWRVQPEIPLDQPYVTITDLLQWVSDIFPTAFTYDFNFYNDQLKHAAYYFTANGWKTFLNYLNSYANYTNVQKDKLFVNANPKGVPILLNQGLLSGRYAWWVQMPIEINYAGYKTSSSRTLTFQILVVRVSTLNNLSGVGIENVIVPRNIGNSSQNSGQ